MRHLPQRRQHGGWASAGAGKNDRALAKAISLCREKLQMLNVDSAEKKPSFQKDAIFRTTKRFQPRQESRSGAILNNHRLDSFHCFLPPSKIHRVFQQNQMFQMFNCVPIAPLGPQRRQTLRIT
jgi:hypothetical protein